MRLDDAFVNYWIDFNTGSEPNMRDLKLFEVLLESAHAIRCLKKQARAIEIIGDSRLQLHPRRFEQFKKLLDRQAGGRTFQPNNELEEETDRYWKFDRIARAKLPTSFSFLIGPIYETIRMMELSRVLKENNAIGYSFEDNKAGIGVHRLYFENELDEIMARISFPVNQSEEV